VIKLHPSTNQSPRNSFNRHITNLEIPLSTLYSHGYLSSSPQSSFDDSDCTQDTSEIYIPISNDDERLNSTKLLSYHTYKYSRRERKRYYSRVKNARIKMNNIISPRKRSRSKEFLSSTLHPTNFLINLPTKISSRQRIPSNSNKIYPLLLSPNFYTLVQYPTHDLLKNYLLNINICFNLIHSIASQEFQIIVNNSDNQQDFSYSSLLNILRQTMFDYTTNLQTTFKRNYFQSFHDDEDENNQHESNGLSIPPLKIRRYDGSSYEIDKRSVSSSASSASSGMSITQIHNGHQYEDRRRFETRTKKFPSRISDNQINSNFNDNEKKDISYLTVGSPLANDLSIIEHQQSKE
jgi:hypothetical protein